MKFAYVMHKTILLTLFISFSFFVQANDVAESAPTDIDDTVTEEVEATEAEAVESIGAQDTSDELELRLVMRNLTHTFNLDSGHNTISLTDDYCNRPIHVIVNLQLIGVIDADDLVPGDYTVELRAHENILKLTGNDDTYDVQLNQLVGQDEV